MTQDIRKIEMTPAERINMLRLSLHVHSVLYYHMDMPLITDDQFDWRTKELLRMQSEYPNLSKRGYMPELFDGWNGNTGMHFPMTDYITNLANELVRLEERYREAQENG